MVLALSDADVIDEDSRSALLIKARAVLDVHHAGPDAFCGGCLQQWARLAPVPCESARWAGLVLETHGVAVSGVPSEKARPG